MNARALFDLFHRAFPATLPVGYELRDAFPERWFRVPSFDDDRRYPGSPADWVELVARHRSLADAVVGVGARALVVAGWFEEEGEPDPRERCDLPLVPWSCEPLPELPGARFLAAPFDYAFERLEPLVRLRSEDDGGPLVVFSERGRLYAPFDGGADLFLRDPAERDAFRAFFDAGDEPPAVAL